MYCMLMNAPNEDIQIITDGMTWDDFKTLWIQTCAWIPKERNRQSMKLNSSRRLPHDEDSD